MLCLANDEAKYFCEQDWTVDSALIAFWKFDFWRNGVSVIPRDGANGSRECAPDDRLRTRSRNPWCRTNAAKISREGILTSTLDGYTYICMYIHPGEWDAGR
jgi:hypothetical protein